MSIYDPPASYPEWFDMGDRQRTAYEALYGEEPPGYIAVQSGNQGSVPSQLNSIRNNTAFEDYYEGLWNTLNATIAYPTFDLYWVGEPSP